MHLTQSTSAVNPCAAVYELARLVYRLEGVIPAEVLESWWHAHPELFWLAYEGQTLCAYTAALPLTKQAFRRTLSFDFDEKSLEPTEILRFAETGDYQVYFSSVVVHPDFRGKGVSRALRQAFLKNLLALWEQGFYVKELSALVVSEPGAIMMQSLGMAYTSESLAGKVFWGQHNLKSLQQSHKNLS